jgi:GMP synthase-like glutamine amidotransferase
VRVLAIVHDADAGPGVFADAITEQGAELDRWHISAASAAPRDPLEYDAVISLGGEAHPNQADAYPWLSAERTLLGELLTRETPLLGVCLGAELLAEAAGGGARAMPRPEVGWHRVAVSELAATDPLLGPLAPEFQALEWHSYELVLPPGAAALATSPVCPQAFRIGSAAWAIQFHAEVTHADLTAWIDQERTPQEAARLGLDADDLRARTLERIDDWNDLGRRLCARFLETAARA